MRCIDRPNITIFFTVFAVAVSFTWLGVDDPSRWEAGVALYILGRKSSNYVSRFYTDDELYQVITYQAGLCISSILLGY